VIDADQVLPSTAAPGSIQDELRAYNSMEPAGDKAQLSTS